MMAKEYFESTDEMTITRVGDDSCLIQTQKTTMLLTYDAAYDLVLRLAGWLDHVQTKSDHEEFCH